MFRFTRFFIALFISNDSLLRKINKSIIQQVIPLESASVAYLLNTLNAFL